MCSLVLTPSRGLNKTYFSVADQGNRRTVCDGFTVFLVVAWLWRDSQLRFCLYCAPRRRRGVVMYRLSFADGANFPAGDDNDLPFTRYNLVPFWRL